MNQNKIVITGGGTGGHVFPALAIAEEMRSRHWLVQYVGTAHGMESKLVPDANFPFFTVKTGAIKNQSILKIIFSLSDLVLGVLWGIRFLIREKPNVVLGVGGYVSVPICLAAFLLRVPLFLQEQNSSVGIANRFLGRLASKVFLGFPDAAAYFAPNKCINTGNPLRSIFYRPQFFSYRADNQFLLILGGSQGSKVINEAIVKFLPTLLARFPKAQVFHQTGKKDFDSLKAAVGNQYGSRYRYEPFTNDIAALYAKASLVIGRSGALTVSELIQAGCPAIFVPYPRKGQNDQMTNAYLVAEQGAAKVVEQGEDFSARLAKTTLEIFEPSVLEGMAKGYGPLRFGNALSTIADEIQAQVDGTV